MIGIVHKRVLLSLAMLLTLTTAVSADSVWVSDLDLSKTRQDWGTAQKNQSVDKHPMTLGTTVYDHGVGTHAESVLMIDLHGAATRLTAVVGLDKELDDHAEPVIFKVVSDRKKILWTSGPVKLGDAPQPVDVDLTGVQAIKLLVVPANDSIRSTHVDWADAKIQFAGVQPVTMDAPSTAAAILTPPAPATPRINGPAVFGVHPGNPVLYFVPVTGDRPMTITATDLPTGLTLDPATGQLTGAISEPGVHEVILHAANPRGKADRKLRIVVGETIALTPPLGWNSWNVWGESVDQEKVIGSAKGMVASGLINHGWSYINIDDTWQGARGGQFNGIQPDPKRFSDMRALCDSIHGMGLRTGIYSSPWMQTYGNRIGGSADNPQGLWIRGDPHIAKNQHVKPFDVGQYHFAANDAKQFAAWGFDYLKYDWGPIDLKNSAEMSDALRHCGRDIVFSLSNNAAGNVRRIISDLGPTANAWRTTGDINDSWDSVRKIGFGQQDWVTAQSPGHYNDTDMLVVGQLGWGHLHPTHLSPDEQYTHISLWSLLGSPLLIGCDLSKIDPFTFGLLSNDEVLAVDQDELCKPATCVVTRGDWRVFEKPLADGSVAVGVFNLGSDEADGEFSLAELGFSGQQAVRDLWRQIDEPAIDRTLKMTVASHGVCLMKLSHGG